MLGLSNKSRRAPAKAESASTDALEMAAAGAPLPGLLGDMVTCERLAFALADADGQIVQVGGDFQRITGRDPGDRIVGRRLSALVAELQLRDTEGSHLLDGPTVLSQIAELRETRERKRLHCLTQTDDGRVLSITTLLPGDGRALACLRDVSDIDLDRRMLKVAMEAASAGYWSLDLLSGQFSYSDTVLDRLSDRERATIERNGLFSIIAKEDLNRVSSQWMDILAGVAPFDLTYRVTTEADGLMWQRSIGQLQRRPDGKLVKAIAFVMDITQDMQTRVDLVEAKALANSREDFMARMTHEIRTPLNAIIGMADSLSDETMSDTVRDAIKTMEGAAENLHELLSRTLDNAKLSEGEVEASFAPADPREVLDACAAMWRPKAVGKGLDFRLAVAPDLPARLPLDSFRLRQCLNNLIGNAVKFTHEGAITLAARTVRRGGEDHICVVVQDTGIGIAPDDQDDIFKAYRQAGAATGRNYGGTGLGLSICRQLAALMGGEITLRSREGEGSAFVLFLPLDPEAHLARRAEPQADAIADAKVQAAPMLAPHPAHPADTGRISAPATTTANDAPAAAAHTASAPPLLRSGGNGAPAINPVEPVTRLPFEGLSVLCVEDNPINQKVVERLIGGRVSQLHFANHGREALSVLNTVHVDVVLMDIHMPVMDGIETTMEIRNSTAAYANVVIIALTADPDYQQLRICKNIGMDDTIGKPVRREDILQAFNRALSRIGEDFGVQVALG